MKKIDFSKFNWKKFHIKRWHFELIILGLLLIPIMFFIAWLQQTTEIRSDSVMARRLLMGIVAGVLGQAIWFLGVSVLAINLLKEILEELKSLRRDREIK